MIAVHMNLGSEEHGSKFFECFNNGEKFFFDGCVIALGFVELASVEGNRAAILFEDSAKLEASVLMSKGML